MTLRSQRGVILAAALLLGGQQCQQQPSAPVVVAPVGPAAQVAQQGDKDTINKLEAELAAMGAKADGLAAVLSKAGAGNENITEFATKEPASNFTTGITNESAGIAQLATSYITAADRAAAAERKVAVLSGDLARMTAAYQTADAANAALIAQNKAKDDALQAAHLETVQAVAAQKAKDDAAMAEQKSAAAKLQAAFDSKQHELDTANKRLTAQAAKERLVIIAVSYVCAVVLIVAGILFIVYAGTYAFMGPKAGLALIAGGIASGVLGTVLVKIQDFADAHPYGFWWTIVGICVLVAAGLGIAASNHNHFVKPVTPAPTQPQSEPTKTT